MNKTKKFYIADGLVAYKQRTHKISTLRIRDRITTYFMIGIIKGKAAPLQSWSGPEGSRKLRFPEFMTTAQDGGKVVSLTHRPTLPPDSSRGTHFC